MSLKRNDEILILQNIGLKSFTYFKRKIGSLFVAPVPACHSQTWKRKLSVS